MLCACSSRCTIRHKVVLENYPFAPGEHKRIAVKIVDDRGIESLKVMPVLSEAEGEVE